MRLAEGQSPFSDRVAQPPLIGRTCFEDTHESLTERGTVFNGLPAPPGFASRVDHEPRAFAFGLTGGR